MNPNEMSLSECWGWLCEDDGIRAGELGCDPTLDAIDMVRPEGWRIQISTEPDGSWHGMGFRLKGALIVSRNAPDRLTCEARLCVAMWMAEGKA